MHVFYKLTCYVKSIYWNRQCWLNAQLQMKQREEWLEAKRFAYSIILTGSEKTKALELFALNDIHILFQKVICRYQKYFQKQNQDGQSFKSNLQNNEVL